MAKRMIEAVAEMMMMQFKRYTFPNIENQINNDPIRYMRNENR